MKTTKTTMMISLTALFALSGYNCNDIFKDPGFDVWCGDTLCEWNVEAGQVRRVATWHRSDTGVEMVGADVVLSQFVDRSHENLSCVRFELIADVAETASVTLEFDFFADGVIDHEQTLPTSHWAELSYRLKLPDRYQGILFRIHKRGSGRAVLAEIAALEESDCGDLPALVPVLRPDGAVCKAPAMDSTCTGGVCTAMDGQDPVCGQCADSSECAAGDVCGVVAPAAPYLLLYRACVPAASHGLGERCADSAECDTGICEGGVCSTCSQAGAGDCPAEQQCRLAIDHTTAEGFTWPHGPYQCEPDAGLGAPGTTCLVGGDCQSGACISADQRRLCLADARPCEQDSDCPLSIYDPADSITGTCVTVGAIDGICQ